MAELLVVATPIGNLNDLTPRMIEALTSCDLIAAEDTRVTMKLLNHLNIKKPSTSLNRHNEREKAGAIAERMAQEDLTVCLTCDAGTPGISDPGHVLVDEAIRRGVRVTPVCGPSAVTAHLSATGFDARAFAFHGFLPREKKAILDKLDEIHRAGIPVAVLYESPHRIVKLLEAVREALPECAVSVACDISKRYEAILTGPVSDVLEKIKANPNAEKGEYSVVLDLSQVPARAPDERADVPIEAQLVMDMLSGHRLSEAAERAIAGGHPRNQVYRAKLKIKALLGD